MLGIPELYARRLSLLEGGKFLGSTVGGLVGAELGKYASGPVCLALGYTTGIGGVVCVATLIGGGAWVGTTSGGDGGEFLGEKLYEGSKP